MTGVQTCALPISNLYKYLYAFPNFQFSYKTVYQALKLSTEPSSTVGVEEHSSELSSSIPTPSFLELGEEVEVQKNSVIKSENFKHDGGSKMKIEKHENIYNENNKNNNDNETNTTSKKQGSGTSSQGERINKDPTKHNLVMIILI